MKPFPLRLLALLLTLPCSLVQAPSIQAQQPADRNTVGQINFFGYGGIPLKPVRDALPIHAGDTLHEKDLPAVREQIAEAIAGVTGQSPTDIAVVCCDASNRLTLYIGLAGTSSHPVTDRRALTGEGHLEPAALKLYAEDITALEAAAAAGVAGEDDSTGYALSRDTAAHQVQLAMRAYAQTHAPALEEAVLHHADPADRRAAAALLGYADRSEQQISTLVFAAGDPDAEVRNNAIRALAVLSAANDAPATQIPVTPFLNLLYSPEWTDRNKASLLLTRLSEGRDPALLARFRTEALPPLLEGANWSDPNHAYAFLILLGRAEGVPEDRLKRLDALETSRILRDARVSAEPEAAVERSKPRSKGSKEKTSSVKPAPARKTAKSSAGKPKTKTSKSAPPPKNSKRTTSSTQN